MSLYYTICDLSSPRVVWKLSFTVTWSGAQGRWLHRKMHHFHLLAENFHVFPFFSHPKNEKKTITQQQELKTSMKLVTSSNQKRDFSHHLLCHGSIFTSLFSGHRHSELQQSPWPVEKCCFRCGICGDTFSTTGLQDMWPQCGMNDVFFSAYSKRVQLLVKQSLGQQNRLVIFLCLVYSLLSVTCYAKTRTALF